MHFRLLTAALAATALATATLGTAAPAAAQGVKIGILNDQSGVYADYGGKWSLEAAKMAVEDFGGEVLGQKIELISADHQNKPDNAVAIARKWYDVDGVDMITELTTSSVALAIQDLSKEKKKIDIVVGAATSRITGDACTPYGFHWAYDTHALAVGTGGALVKDTLYGFGLVQLQNERTRWYGNSSQYDETNKTPQYLLKLDWNVSDNHKVNVRYTKSEETNPIFPNFTANQLSLSSDWYSQAKTLETVVGQWFADWTDSFSTELKISQRDYKSDPINNSNLPQVGLVWTTTAPAGTATGNRTLTFGTEQSRHFNSLHTKTFNSFFAGNLFLATEVTPSEPIGERIIEVPEDEAEHLSRVLRLGAGDEVDVFDGHGALWRAEIVQVGKKSAAVLAAMASAAWPAVFSSMPWPTRR